jgi:hypothetical protein
MKCFRLFATVPFVCVALALISPVRIRCETAPLHMPDEPGVYVIEGSSPVAMTPHTPASKGGGTWRSMGFKPKVKAYLPGKDAGTKVASERPSFLLYTQEGYTPDDYVLLKMDEHGDRREFQVGEMGMFGGKSGLPASETRPITAEKLAPRVYRLTPSGPLSPGDYGFFLAAGEVQTYGGGAVHGAALQGRVWDFTIPGNK